MLTIEKADKYFNKGRRNQVHVIDNTSLTLPDTGLIALLGPSGCGKTTLLNTIGGLDKLKKGKIFINGEKISSRCVYKVDKIRNLNVGYIFQDYKLIEEKSVYDNVAIVLKMIGLRDKLEIKKRVEYVLDRVGMLRYKRRPANMLSGGEKQRVAIARAIVKNPTIILADEPTGNLDSKNSLEIMKILQAISKEKLVILVTHEQNLARFYANRIIEISDGKVIKDEDNTESLELDYQLESNFYLQDFDVHDVFHNEKYDINVYSSKEDKIELDLVVANGNVYIKSKTKDKVEVVDEESSIEFINDHYKKTTKDEVDNYSFNLNNISNNNFKKKYSSIYNPISLIVNGFDKVLNYSFGKKLLLIGFFLAGCFMIGASAGIYNSYQINDKDFVEYNKNYLILNTKNIKVNDYLEYEKYDDINYILPGNSTAYFRIKYDDYYQSKDLADNYNGSVSSLSMINEDNIIYGEMARLEKEAVIDKMILDNLLKVGNSKMIGISKVEEFLGREIEFNDYSKFKIVGITDLESPSIYIKEEQFLNIFAYSDFIMEELQYFDYNLFKKDITLTKGSWPINDYEVIVNETNSEEMPLNKTIDNKINDKKLKVVGYYKTKEDYNYFFVNSNTVKYNLIRKSKDIAIYSKDKNKTISTFVDKKMNIEDSYETSKKEYIKEVKSVRNVSLTTSLMLLAISLIELYLMMRSSFLSRIKEIGILRAIGIKRLDIYKMFFGEIIAVVTLGGIPGIILMTYAFNKTASNDYVDLTSIKVEPLVLIATIIVMYLFNLIIGLLPVFNTIRKTPASILSRHDVE